MTVPPSSDPEDPRNQPPLPPQPPAYNPPPSQPYVSNPGNVYPPPPPYQPSYPYGPAAPLDTKAIVSLVLGVVSVPLVLCYYVGVLTAIAAIVVGVLSLRQFKREPNVRRGRGMALAGVILGAVVLVIAVIMVVATVIIMNQNGTL